MIDVMFFLLVTFMLASLTLQPINAVQIELPRGTAAPIQKRLPVTLSVTPDSHLFLDKTPVTLDSLVPTLKPLLNPADPTVIIAADDASPHGIMVQAMIRARQAGARHFLIAVQHGR